MSKMFNQIKEWYDSGYWSLKRVKNAVGKKITAEEYTVITGKTIDGGNDNE